MILLVGTEIKLFLKFTNFPNILVTIMTEQGIFHRMFEICMNMKKSESHQFSNFQEVSVSSQIIGFIPLCNKMINYYSA